ncbi:hypothetical protein H072_6704 [Dactylellina haptotyla CBS 200.50]|uniref:Peptidase A1 domain-containing protein n=1 Tax=Dactylellina haptotyla (strain CBS 200.50) TaxID=1284197 RepID=S8A983_DACHA|nr:hypothetical protein H072_6704 [Dactylellina haptotyla CBS 200.50]
MPKEMDRRTIDAALPKRLNEKATQDGHQNASVYAKSIPRNCTGVENIPQDCPDVRHREIEVGGFFDGNISKTYHGPEYSKLDDVIPERAYDLLRLGDNGEALNLGNSSFETEHQNYWEVASEFDGPDLYNYIGLSNSSTILNYLKNRELIATKSYSFFGGWDGTTEETSQDGLLVLGGYDKSILTSDFIAFPQSDYRLDIEQGTCLLRIIVKGISMSHVGGDFELYEDSVGFPMCINPRQRGVDIQWEAKIQMLQALDVYDPPAFTDDTSFDPLLDGRIYLDRSDKQLQRYLDSMQLTFHFDGVNISIPGHQLWTFQKNATSQGYKFADNSVNTTVLRTGPTDLYTSSYGILGLPFLAAAYLMVNHDDYTFSLAPAQAEKLDISKRNIVPIVPSECIPATVPSNSTIPTTDLTIVSWRKVGPGAIVGIVVGVIASIALLAGGVFFWYRRRKGQLLVAPSPPNTRGIHEVGGGEIFEMQGDFVFSGAKAPKQLLLKRVRIFTSLVQKFKFR